VTSSRRAAARGRATGRDEAGGRTNHRDEEDESGPGVFTPLVIGAEPVI
jgi:hypothetical protein